VLADFADLEALDNRRNAAGVSAEVALETTDVKAGGRSLRFRAKNAGDSRRGSWRRSAGRTSTPISACCPVTPWPVGQRRRQRRAAERPDTVAAGIPRLHLGPLHRPGFHRLALCGGSAPRADSERLTDYVWPYGDGGSHAIYRNAVDRAHISEVNLLLNEIPANGKVDILVSPIVSLTARRAELANPSWNSAEAR